MENEAVSFKEEACSSIVKSTTRAFECFDEMLAENRKLNLISFVLVQLKTFTLRGKGKSLRWIRGDTFENMAPEIESFLVG